MIAKFCSWANLFVLGFFTYAIGLISVAGFFGRVNWLFELASHFRLVYCYLFLALAILFLLIKRPGFLLGAAIFFLLNFSQVLPFYFPSSNKTKTDLPTAIKKHRTNRVNKVRILQFNVQGGLNSDFDKTIDLIDQTAPDIVGISEITETWKQVLDKRLKGYRYKLVQPKLGGIALYSKIPLIESQLMYTGRIKRPRIVAQMRIADQPTMIVFAHPVIPILHGNLRNEELAAIGKELRDFDGASILFGDLNCTPWSCHFEELLKTANLQDSERGFGIVPTWSARWSIHLFPIDHCLVTKEFIVVDRKVLKSVGSDHYPVLVDLERR